MNYSPVGLLFIGFLLINSCTQTESVQLQVNAAKDTAWLYPTHLNPLLIGQPVVVTIESNLGSCGYLLIENEMTKAISVNGNRKETRVKSSSRRMIPSGQIKVYFTESYAGPTRYSYKTCGPNTGQLKIVFQKMNIAKGELEGFAVLPLTKNKLVTTNRLQTVD
jgi:hypothetical protein